MNSLIGVIRRIAPDGAGGLIRVDGHREVPFALTDILEYDAALLAVGQRVIFSLPASGPARARDIQIHRTAAKPAPTGRELRFRGFTHTAGAREYRFEWAAAGEPPRPAVVRVDLNLFVRHGVRIQEGPALCARRVAAAPRELRHELSDQDFRDFLARMPAPGVRSATRRPRRAIRPETPGR